MSSEEIAAVEKIVGHTFSEPLLLVTALTHESFVNERKDGKRCKSNERLEFLGDSVLGMIVTEYLFRAYDSAEGVLTDMRQHIVSKEPLAAAVRDMGLLHYYRLGRGARSDKNKFKDKTVSNLFEAVLGAIYLDGGWESARQFVHAHLLSRAPSPTGK